VWLCIAGMASRNDKYAPVEMPAKQSTRTRQRSGEGRCCAQHIKPKPAVNKARNVRLLGWKKPAELTKRSHVIKKNAPKMTSCGHGFTKAETLSGQLTATAARDCPPSLVSMTLFPSHGRVSQGFNRYALSIAETA
jgi:hypothetical protein